MMLLGTGRFVDPSSPVDEFRDGLACKRASTTREAGGARIDDLPGPEELGWSPQPMVRWLSPSGLSTTSAQLLLSGIFGAYADKREIQAALKEPSGIDLSNRPGLTLDFMADTGDGFNPTYAVARALAEPHLPVADGAQELRLPRGQVLVLGGDIAYPAASRDEFQNRFALRRCLSRPRGWAARSTPGVPMRRRRWPPGRR
jgi:hypothetical protein